VDRVPIRPVISTVMPVSSMTSRMAVSVIVSPSSWRPPGMACRSLSVRRMTRSRPMSSSAKTLTAITMLVAFGAFGSSE
jgi:hypothetical protein